MSRQISDSSDDAARAAWLSLLAKADAVELERCWQAVDDKPAFALLRQPEIGAVMVRGRIGGTGGPFNLGEMTVTRCSVRSDSGAVGHGYVAGRNPRHAELAAMVDAAMQDEARADAVRRLVLAPLAARAEAQRDARARKAAATRVEFFTMVRGED